LRSVSSIEGNGFPAATKNGEIKAAKINYRAQKKLSYIFEYNISFTFGSM